MTPQSERIMAELMRRVVETAVLTVAARRQGTEFEPGMVYSHHATASYDVEWAVLEQKETGGVMLYVVAADPLTLRGQYDVSVDPTATCGALSLRCAMGAWVAASVFRSEFCSGSLPSHRVEQARIMCQRARSARANGDQADLAAGVLTPDWDPDTYRERLQQLATAVRLLESLTNAQPAMTNGFEGVEDDEISALYETIARRAETLDPASAVDDPELSRAWTTLRRLQTEEADRYQGAFEASLAMPIDAGKALLKRARTLRQRFENPPDDHPAGFEPHQA